MKEAEVWDICGQEWFHVVQKCISSRYLLSKFILDRFEELQDVYKNVFECIPFSITLFKRLF